MGKKKKVEKQSNKSIVWIIIIGLLVITCISGVLFSFFSKDKPDIDNENNINPNLNTNTGVVEDKNINNILFSNIECSFDGSYSLLTYKVTNNSSETLMPSDYEIIVKNKDGNIIANMVLSIMDKLEPTQSIDTGNSIDIDLREAYQIELINDTL